MNHTPRLTIPPQEARSSRAGSERSQMTSAESLLQRVPVLTQPAVAAGSRVPFAVLPERASPLRAEHRAIHDWPYAATSGRDARQRSRTMEGKARNVSRTGALVQYYRALPVACVVRIRSAELYFLSGCARFQHCSRRGFTYQIGLKSYAELAGRYN